MAFGIEKYKTMEIPIPNDEEVLLVPRTLCWVNNKSKWTDTILVLTDKGIHFRVRKDKLGIVNRYWGNRLHNLIDNTFFAYDRIESYERGSLLWKNTYLFEMVDGCKLRFAFHKDMDQVTTILDKFVQPGTPRNTGYYDYNDHHPERVPHRNVPVAK